MRTKAWGSNDWQHRCPVQEPRADPDADCTSATDRKVPTKLLWRAVGPRDTVHAKVLSESPLLWLPCHSLTVQSIQSESLNGVLFSDGTVLTLPAKATLLLGEPRRSSALAHV